MARPTKNNAYYFSHDSGMRNHRKVKALRNKFSTYGYAVWCMLLEYLTESDGNEFEQSDTEYELMAGDFGVSATEIRELVSYCISLELLFNRNGFIHSESLDERLAPVYIKRGVAKQLSKKQCRVNGKFCNRNADDPVVSVTEIPQSKVKESKVNKTREEIAQEIFSDELYIEGLNRAFKGKDFRKAFEECYNHHSLKLTPPSELHEWKQKLNSWLTSFKAEKTNGYNPKIH
ncbi:MAG: DUF4373 domain-containing protein [Candidatus Doudnabacteria bacterium]|nr:DUF4373 domain-containing protein [Candidatus Doudnabacteria bacterium]